MKNITERLSRRITMSVLNHRILRYLLILPTILLIAHGVFSLRLDEEIEREILREKFLEKVQDLDMMYTIINDFAEQNDDGAYESAIVSAVSSLDAVPLTFAAAYDSLLSPVSRRTKSYGAAFDPFAYPEFAEAVMANNSGTYTVSFLPAGEPVRDVLLCYRWLPDAAPDAERYLAVIGISRFSVSTPIALWVAYGNIVLSAITAFCNYFMIALLLSVSGLNGRDGGASK